MATQAIMHPSPVKPRRFPYPFRAALAICSDIDGTTTLERFLAIQEFLNTDHVTAMGPGVGLEIGNSFFPYTPDDRFAYFSSRPADRETIETFIKAGYIDSLHSYGDGVVTRAEALRALEAFERDGLKLDVWIDHARAPSNFGKDVTPGQGDVRDAPIYHADATLAYGIRFVWKGQVSSIVGHGVPFTARAFARIFDRARPRHTIYNLGKEIAKVALACAGSRRFAIHCRNRLVRVAPLQDGQRVYEFRRCNNHWRGLGHGHDAAGLAYVLRRKALADLRDSEGYMVVYTHIGVGPARPPYLPPETQAALRGLAAACRAGDLYVTTTSRLLHYTLNHRYLQWSAAADDEGWTHITISGVDDPLHGPRLPGVEALQGMTFYVPESHKTRLFLGDQAIPVVANPADHTGQQSVTIPRTFLTYPLPPQRQSSQAGTGEAK